MKKNYGTIPNTMKLSFTVEKTMVYGKYYGTMEKNYGSMEKLLCYSKLWCYI